jgi:hypothetical protein
MAEQRRHLLDRHDAEHVATESLDMTYDRV